MADTGNYTTQILSFDHDLLSEVEWMSAENARLRAQRPQPSDMREGIRPDADGFQAHLIWWPDELPVPLFEGAPGSRIEKSRGYANAIPQQIKDAIIRRLVAGLSDPSVHYVDTVGAQVSIHNTLQEDLATQNRPIAASDDTTPMKGAVPGQDDSVTRRINDAIDDLTARRVVGRSRKDLREALDAADKPETGPLPGGVHRAPDGLGRALAGPRGQR